MYGPRIRVLVLRILQAAGLVALGYSLRVAKGASLNVKALAGSILLTVIPFVLDRFQESRERRSELERRLRQVMHSFDIDGESHAIVFIRGGWMLYKLSHGRLCAHPKTLRAVTREVTPTSERGFSPNVKPKTNSGAAGSAFRTRKVIAGHFSSKSELDAFSKNLNMDDLDVDNQSFKAAIYTVPIYTDSYSIGAIYITSQRKEDFDLSTTEKPDPTTKIKALRRMLEEFASELATG